MLMFSSQAQVKMSLDFPPRERLDSILLGINFSQRVVGLSEVDSDSTAMGDNGVERRLEIQVNSNHYNFPVLKLELLVFDETKPHWWVRQCEIV